MGREIRRVPPDWEHPIATRENWSGHSSHFGHPKPTYDESYREAAEKWIAEFSKWLADGRPPILGGCCRYYWEYDAPPDEETHREREWTPEEATAYQVYETVSEGTPVSPVLMTRDDLLDWIVENMNVSRAGAERFAEVGSAPSLMVTGDRIYSNAEALDAPEATR